MADSVIESYLPFEARSGRLLPQRGPNVSSDGPVSFKASLEATETNAGIVLNPRASLSRADP